MDSHNWGHRIQKLAKIVKKNGKKRKKILKNYEKCGNSWAKIVLIARFSLEISNP